MDIISLKGVSKSFNDNKILDDISLYIKKGESIALVGKSGSGKSVLIKILIGFLNKDSGIIEINPNIENKIGFSMQNNSIYDYLTVKQNLKYFSEIYKIPKKIRNIIIPELINKLSLDEFKNVLAKKLSGGTKKRIDIACALLNNPEVLILDEPFLGLDPELVNRLGNFILELNKMGKTIIISSHGLDELKKICTRFVLVKDKKLKIIGRDELVNAYK
jgi:ABC-2 type transport system ATP-binding protein